LAVAFDLSELMRDVSIPDTGRETLSYLPYAALIPDPNNGYSMNGLEELARSIELVGLQQPLRVKALGAETYGIISGHRRHAAIGLILEENPEAFPDGVPCIVDRADGSVALRELQLLLANADNRKMTSADEAQQAERISECLRKLEDEGYVFPGRHRDWVSKISGLSRTKLARLNVIKTKLDPKLKKQFYDKGKLKEEAAYELARLPEEKQHAVAAWYNGRDVKPENWYSSTIRQYAEDLERVSTFTCPTKFGRKPCVNQCGIMDAIWSRGYRNYGHCSYGKKCCATCDSLASCAHVCGHMVEKAEELRRERKLKNKELKAAEEAAEAPLVDRVRALWLRFGNALGRADMEDEELRKITGWKIYQLDSTQIASLEAGEYAPKIKSGTVLPFYNSCYLTEVDRYIKTADALDCSLDYLLMRTDVPEVNTGARAEVSTPEWQSGDPPQEGRYWCKFLVNGSLFTRAARWYDDNWHFDNIETDIRCLCVGWWPMPEEE
jgi:ParB family chromosome partitioning protein